MPLPPGTPHRVVVCSGLGVLQKAIKDKGIKEMLDEARRIDAAAQGKPYPSDADAAGGPSA